MLALLEWALCADAPHGLQMHCQGWIDVGMQVGDPSTLVGGRMQLSAEQGHVATCNMAKRHARRWYVACAVKCHVGKCGAVKLLDALKFPR